MRVVVDANILASGIFWGGQPGRILDLWAHGKLEFLVSLPILSEYSRILLDLGGREGRSALAQHWVAFIGNHAVVLDVHSTVRQCRDPDDDKYLQCALDGAAECIVSGDRDLLALEKCATIPIMTPRQFLNWLT